MPAKNKHPYCRLRLLLRSAIVVLLVEKSTSRSANPFVHVPRGLAEPGASGVDFMPFDRSWLASAMDKFKLEDHEDAINRLPRSLEAPDYVQVFEYRDSKKTVNADACSIAQSNKGSDTTTADKGETSIHSLTELGRMARQVLETQLPRSGAVLFRNLHHRIQTADDFSAFWKACYEQKTEESGGQAWMPGTYTPVGRSRERKDGVDLATNIGSQYPIPCHNEMAYNPEPSRRIAFYCMQDAKVGGETLVARNIDMTRHIRSDIQEYVKTHGGVYNLRAYADRNSSSSGPATATFTMPNPITWQEKCDTEDREEAIRFFQNVGFEDIAFDENGTMTIKYFSSGFAPNVLQTDDQIESSNGQVGKVWFNVLHTNIPFVMLGDGTHLSPKQLVALRADQWNAVSIFKLRPGDWLVLDNRAVQHGRLPYEENADNPRTLLTVYTE